MKVLFLCKANVFRSQMAEGFFNNFSKKDKAESAALVMKDKKMNKLVIRAMKEEGINIEDKTPKDVNSEMLKKADIVIVMNKNILSYLEKIKKNMKKDAMMKVWDIDDIIASDNDEHLYPEFCKARDKIKEKVIGLVNRIEKE